jgi:hypothetical protein
MREGKKGGISNFMKSPEAREKIVTYQTSSIGRIATWYLKPFYDRITEFRSPDIAN